MTQACSICKNNNPKIFEDYPLSAAMPETRICLDCFVKLNKIRAAASEDAVTNEISYFKNLLNGSVNDPTISAYLKELMPSI